MTVSCFTGNFTDASVGALLVSKGITGVSGGRYFTNAADGAQRVWILRRATLSILSLLVEFALLLA